MKEANYQETKKFLSYAVTILISTVAGALGTFYVFNAHVTTYLDNRQSEIIEKTVSEVNITELDSLKISLSKVYHSVVVIEGYNRNSLVSSGSGFVYKVDDSYGYILTNNHVVESSSNIKVTNIDGVETAAEILGTDIYMDIAVLRINKSAVLQIATIGNSSIVEIGDTVFTIGAPGGIDYIGTVTKGIISGLNREVAVKLSNGDNYIMDVIQTDAAINPGNSGGPLVNINGEVIGINSLKIIESSVEGMGFALPIEEVMLYVSRLEAGQTIDRPSIGLELLDITDRYKLRQAQISIDPNINHGAVIYSVMPNSPADVSGLKAGDVILYVNGIKVSDATHFRYLLYKNSVGDTINIKYNRSGIEGTVRVRLTK